MNYEKYNSNNRFFSYDKNQQRLNNQNHVVYPVNNIRNIKNYENNRNYNNYLENENNLGIRKINNNKINPGRFHYKHEENFQNDIDNNNNKQYYNNLYGPNIKRKNEEESNYKFQKENKINAGYLYNPDIPNADKPRKNNENNFKMAIKMNNRIISKGEKGLIIIILIIKN